MSLTSAQLTTLKNHIAATPALNAHPNNADGNQAIADAMNLTAAPDYTVWKTNLTTKELIDTILGESMTALQTAESTVLNIIVNAYMDSAFDPSVADKRNMFLNSSGTGLFTGASNNNPATRTALAVAFKRLATESEKLFASGSGVGSDADPDTMVFEGQLSRSDVQQARDS